MFSEVLGWIGAAAILAAYLLVSMGWISIGYRFQATNLLGSLAFIIYGAYREVWPSVATNAVWFLISVVAMVRLRKTRKQRRSVNNGRLGECPHPTTT